MTKFIKILLIFTIIVIFFSKNIISYYYLKKFSKWVERPVKIESIDFKFSGIVELKNVEINNNSYINYKNIFEAEKIILTVDIKSLFTDLIIIKNLNFINPNFFLDLTINKKEKNNNKLKDLPKYKDNLGLAEKINNNTPDKIWPKKKRDINFIILESYLKNAKTNIDISSLSKPAETHLSDMKFSNFGNQKGYQHYKDVLKFILFDIYASTADQEIKKILKDVYNF